MKDALPLGSTWDEQQRARAAVDASTRLRRPSRWHLLIFTVMLAGGLGWLQFYDARAILVSDSAAVNHGEYHYGLPSLAYSRWWDAYYPPPGSPRGSGYSKIVQGSQWHLGGLALDLFVLSILTLLGFILYRAMVLWFLNHGRPLRLAPPPPTPPVPPAPDDSLDPTPATGDWDEASHR